MSLALPRVLPSPRRLQVLLVAGCLSAVAACGGGGGGGTPGPNPGTGQSMGMNPGNYDDFAKSKNKGGFMNQFGGNELPRRVDLREKGWIPTSMNQGGQGSCVGFASAYGLKSIQEAKEESWRPDDPTRLFSPAFVYNQILKSDDCNAGSQPSDAMELLVKQGCATLATMPYADTDCKATPTNAALEEATKFRAKRSIQLQLNEASLKASLAAGNPVVIGIFLYEPFFQDIGSRGWRYGPDDLEGAMKGGHAMCAVGYDDDKGALIVFNSWGKEWGENGYCYIDYKLLSTPLPVKPDWMVLAMAYTVEDQPNGGDAKKDTSPKDLTASSDNPNFVTLRWTAAAEVQDYLIQRSRDAQSWIDVKRVKETSANDDPGDYATHSYRVFGIKGADRDDPKKLVLTEASNVAQGRKAQAQSEEFPRNVEATRDLALEVRIRWSPMPGARRYLVVRSNDALQGPYDIVDYTAATQTRDLPPVQGKVFFYRVSAVLAQGPSKFSPAVEGSTSSAQPLDLSSDEMLYPVDQFFNPADLVPNGRYSWPYWVATNWSQTDVGAKNHVVLVGLARRTQQGLQRHFVAGWYLDPSFPADTTIFAEDLPFAFSGKDIASQPIESGVYYWFLATFLVEPQGNQLVVREDANPNDNVLYMLDPVRVFGSSSKM